MSFWNLLRFISLKHFRLRKGQTIMAIAGICLGVAAIVSIGVVNRSVLYSFEDSFTQITGKAKLQVSGAQTGFPEELIEKVQEVPGVEYAVPVIETDGLLVAGKERSIMILGVDVLIDSQVRDYSLTGDSSDIPDPLLFLAKHDSILVTKAMAEREGFSIDQKIEVQTVEGIKTFRIRGILNPEGPAKAMGGNLAVMDLYAAQMAFGKNGRIDRIDISIREGYDLDAVRKAIAAALPQGYMVDTPAGRTRQVETMLSKFQNGFNLFSYLAIFVGMYLIYNAVSISVVHRRKEIGILRALGSTQKEVVTLFLGETIVLALVGSLLGVGLGLLLANMLVESFGTVISETYVRTSVNGLHVNWYYPTIGISAGIIASLVAALFPARASSRVSPVSAIRSVPFAEEGFFTTRRLNLAGAVCLVLAILILAVYNIIGDSPLTKNTLFLFVAQFLIIIGVSLFTPVFLRGFVSLFNRVFSSSFGVSGRLAGLNLRKNLTRNAVAVAAVFFGISVFVGSAGFVHSVKESSIRWLDSVVRADILVTSGRPTTSANSQTIPMPVEMEQALEKVPGVLSADPWRRVSMTYKDRTVIISSVDIVKRAVYGSYVFVQGNKHDILQRMPNKDVVVISEPFAAIFKVKTGDTLFLPTPSGPVPFLVAGVVVDYMSDNGTIGMDLHTYQRHWGDRLVNSFSVRIKPGAKVADVRSEIQKRFGSDRKLFVLPAQEFKNEIRQVLDRMFVFNYTLNIITLTIACLGIIVTLFASILERTREIATLRSIGMLRRQISSVVVLESILMGVAGGSLGSFVGIVGGWINLEGFFTANYGSAAQFFIPYWAVFWALILSASLSALAGMIPARKAANTNIVEALSYD
jgi:putative ABC transport system permease protein